MDFDLNENQIRLFVVKLCVISRKLANIIVLNR